MFTMLNIVQTAVPTVTIPTQYPTYADDDANEVVPYAYYYSWTGLGSISGSDTTDPSCGQILQSGSVEYIVHFKGYLDTFNENCDSCKPLRPMVFQVPLLPLEDSTPNIDQISVCSSQTGCAQCLQSGYPQRVQLQITSTFEIPNSNENSIVIFQTACQLSLASDCGPKSCTNGYYATDYLDLDSHGFVLNSVKCLQCKPGTWLTCVFTKTCTWNIPASASDPFTPPYGMYGIPGQVPVGGCYSCPTAGGGKEHYNGTQDGIWIYDHAQTPLQWICPGKADPPQFCLEGFAGANYDYTVCVCGDGKYPIDRTTCAPCPPGYQCSNGTATECADGTYQA